MEPNFCKFISVLKNNLSGSKSKKERKEGRKGKRKDGSKGGRKRERRK